MLYREINKMLNADAYRVPHRELMSFKLEELTNLINSLCDMIKSLRVLTLKEAQQALYLFYIINLNNDLYNRSSFPLEL